MLFRSGSPKGGRQTNLIRLRTRELPAIISAKRNEVTECRKPEIQSNRQRLPETGLPAKIAGKVTGNPAQGYRQMVAGTYKDNPTIPTNPPYPPGFDEVWAVWPKHIRASSKRIASERLARLGVTGPEIVAAASAYLRSPDATKDGRKYVPALEVWLNKQAEFWLERSRPDAAELRRRQELFEFDGTWADEWGPRPSQANGGQP